MPVIDEVKIALLNQQIDGAISRLETNRDRDKKKAKRVTVLSASGSAGATMLLGLSKFSQSLEAFMQSGSLILGTMTTIILAWDKLFNHKRLWIISAQTVRQLYRLKEHIEHTTQTSGMSNEKAVAFYDEYCEILANGDKKWDQIRDQT